MPDQVAPVARGADGVDRRVAVRQRRGAVPLGRAHVGRIEQERIVGELPAHVAQLADQSRQAAARSVAPVAAEGQRARRMAAAGDQVDAQRALRDRARLAHRAAR